MGTYVFALKDGELGATRVLVTSKGEMISLYASQLVTCGRELGGRTFHRLRGMRTARCSLARQGAATGWTMATPSSDEAGSSDEADDAHDSGES